MSSSPERTRSTVVVVEDDPYLIEMVDLLGRTGFFDPHQIELHSNPYSALESISRNSQEMAGVWTDCDLCHDINGLELSGLLKRDLDHTLPIFMFSAESRNGRKAAQAGVDIFLAKPAPIEEMRTAVASFALIRQALCGSKQALQEVKDLFRKNGSCLILLTEERLNSGVGLS